MVVVYLRLSLAACVASPWVMNAFMIPKKPRAMPGSWHRARETRPSEVILRWSAWYNTLPRLAAASCWTWAPSLAVCGGECAVYMTKI